MESLLFPFNDKPFICEILCGKIRSYSQKKRNSWILFRKSLSLRKDEIGSKRKNGKKDEQCRRC